MLMDFSDNINIKKLEMNEIKINSRRKNFLHGVGSVLRIFPRREDIKVLELRKHRKKSEETEIFGDILSLRSDWDKLGMDIFKAVEEFSMTIEKNISDEAFDRLTEEINKYYERQKSLEKKISDAFQQKRKAQEEGSP